MLPSASFTKARLALQELEKRFIAVASTSAVQAAVLPAQPEVPSVSPEPRGRRTSRTPEPPRKKRKKAPNSAFRQPKHSLLAPIIPEFAKVYLIGLQQTDFSRAAALKKLRKLTAAAVFSGQVVEKGCRIIEVMETPQTVGNQSGEAPPPNKNLWSLGHLSSLWTSL